MKRMGRSSTGAVMTALVSGSVLLLAGVTFALGAIGFFVVVALLVAVTAVGRVVAQRSDHNQLNSTRDAP